MINLYYDVITPHGPVGNGIKNYEITQGAHPYPISANKDRQSIVNVVTMFYDLMIEHGCYVNTYTNGKIVPNLFYPIEVLQPRIHISDLIPKDTLEHLVNSDMKAVIFFQEEGADGWAFQTIKILADRLYDAGVAQDNIIIVNGDVNRSYKEYFAPFKVYGIDWWQIKHQQTCRIRYHSQVSRSPRTYDRALPKAAAQREAYNIDLDRTPTKTFLSFNGHKRIHRAGFVSEILARNLQGHGHMSWGVHPGPFKYELYDGRIFDFTKPEDQRVKKTEAMSYILKNQILIDGEGHQFFDIDDRWYDSRYYYDSAFSVVTETFSPFDHNDYPNDEKNVVWTTEKTWKPIAIGHPFMVLGSVGTMKYLRDEGYNTFGELFDESYDSETNLIKRIDKIVDNIEKIIAMPTKDLYTILDSLKPKLKANRELFYKKNHALKFNKLFEQLQNG